MDYKEAQKYYPGWKYAEVIYAFDNLTNKLLDLVDIDKIPQDDRNKIFSDLVTLDHHLKRWCK